MICSQVPLISNILHPIWKYYLINQMLRLALKQSNRRCLISLVMNRLASKNCPSMIMINMRQSIPIWSQILNLLCFALGKPKWVSKSIKFSSICAQLKRKKTYCHFSRRLKHWKKHYCTYFCLGFWSNRYWTRVRSTLRWCGVATAPVAAFHNRRRIYTEFKQH